MNIFVVNKNPHESAYCLPDKHVVKMPLESSQMLSIVFSEWYYGWGTINKVDGTPYSTTKGAFRNHPCTKWVAENIYNTAWLIVHGLALCTEYRYRYKKEHSCNNTLLQAKKLFYQKTNEHLNCYSKVNSFTRAMPDEYKLDNSIDTFTAYKMYIASKPWAASNYLRVPERKPNWMISNVNGSGA